MVTETSPKTKQVADANVEKLRAENERLKAGIIEVRQGTIFKPKNGKIALSLFQVNPNTEFPIRQPNDTEINGKRYANYKIGKWMVIYETDLMALLTGEKNFCNVYFEKKLRKA